MTELPSQEQILAFAVYELRLLLAGHIDSPKAEVRAAAKLAYSLHNEALAVLRGSSFDRERAIAAMSKLDRDLGQSFMIQFSELTKRAV